MTYCTPRAVQEQILKRKLAASGCAVTLNKDRPDAATRRPSLPDVPDDVLLHLLGYCDASTPARWRRRRARYSVCDGRRRGTNSKKLCGAVVCARAGLAKAQRFCSLGDHERRLGLRPRAPARQIYRAFCTKKVAEGDIDTVDLEGGEDALEELAFIASSETSRESPAGREE